ncbi:hypothetical protein SAMN05444487_106165 [Marininema mesophilum]|uniref:Uncharacterized protein n=1 Tax=Marininema mesophilum TaxID=1048340 RepID=A0A1H2WL37_9BACL|nr:hypothetical protein [Marininema mesophilum]SDW81218.1 hypothetical protein SAMN05444487_106165 [Marininema mesophilum]
MKKSIIVIAMFSILTLGILIGNKTISNHYAGTVIDNPSGTERPGPS